MQRKRGFPDVLRRRRDHGRAEGARTRALPRPILIVEDDEDLRFLLTVALRRDGHVVDSVTTGEEALERLSGGGHALVLLDIRLPGIDGFEVLRRLPRPLAAPVIAMSAHAHHELATTASALGCTTYLNKPFTPSELVSVVDRCLAAA